MVDRCQSGRFELVEFRRGRYRIRCKTCGNIVERARSTIRQKTVVCDACKAAEEERKELEDARKQVVRALAAVKELKTPKTCKGCGKTFYDQSPYKAYCSKLCKKQARNNHRKRARKYGAVYEKGITLIKVFNRDNGICQICGEPCNWEDNSWGESFGATYPTIDHKKALANGGGHTWSNVQLAHAICNSYKRDTV